MIVTELGEEISRISKQYPEISFNKLSCIAEYFVNWQKKQMLKEAVEGVVTYDNRGNNVVRVGVFNKDFEYGDKVRVIIVKED